MTDIDTLPAGRELDALVAEKVMGLMDHGAREQHEWGDDFDVPDYHSGHCCKWCGVYEPTCGCPKDDVGPCVKEPQPYSTSIAAAWDVVEKMSSDHGYWMTLQHETDGSGPIALCQFSKDGSPTIHAYGDTAPLAICRAALKAAGA